MPEIIPENSTPLSLDNEHSNNSDLIFKQRFDSFEAYVKACGHGMDYRTACRKAYKGAQLLAAIQNNQPLPTYNNATISREANISNLVWFLVARSFANRDAYHSKPLDGG